MKKKPKTISIKKIMQQQRLINLNLFIRKTQLN